MSNAKQKIPGRNKGRFEDAHSTQIEDARGWTKAETKRCLEFLWYTVLSREEKLRYDGVQETRLTWSIPYAVPPKYAPTVQNQRLREAFADDPTNYDRPVGAESYGDSSTAVNSDVDDDEPDAPDENAPPVDSEPAEAEPEGDANIMGKGDIGRNGEGDGSGAPDENAPPVTPGHSLSTRPPWPNLAHIPDLPAASPSPTFADDQTGFFPEGQWEAYYHGECRLDLRHSVPIRNRDEQNLRHAVNWERLILGGVEAQGGSSVLNHEGGRWRFKRALGQGGYGKVGLWLKEDVKTGRILDRIAVKEETTSDPREWISPLHWRDGLPKEISIQEHLKKIDPPCPYLMSSRGYRVNAHQRRWRLYLPYKPGQTLRQPIDCRTGWADDYDIPLDFVFYTFLAMAEAGLALECGWWGGQENQPSVEEMRENGGRKQGWVPIVHRDIKPDNTFLGGVSDDGEERWDMYPTPCIGDMGLSVEAYPGDPYNPDNYVHSGTFGYMAPEQCDHYPFGASVAREISDRTNVYAIATSVFKLWQDRLPGFLAVNKKLWEDGGAGDDDEGDLAVLPPHRDDKHVTEQLVAHYMVSGMQELMNDDDQPDEVRVRAFVGTKCDLIASRMMGPARWSCVFVYLWELEKWRPDWLLRNIVHIKTVPSSPDGEDMIRIGHRPLEGEKEHRLASILRQCLAPDADGRPSIRKLRDMVRTAIDDLDIRPSRTDTTRVEKTGGEDVNHPAPWVWLKGGLLYSMDDLPAYFDSVEAVDRQSLDQRLFRVKAFGLFDLYRRALLQNLRPAPLHTLPLQQDPGDGAYDDDDDDDDAATVVAGASNADNASGSSGTGSTGIKRKKAGDGVGTKHGAKKQKPAA